MEQAHFTTPRVHDRDFEVAVTVQIPERERCGEREADHDGPAGSGFPFR